MPSAAASVASMIAAPSRKCSMSAVRMSTAREAAARPVLRCFSIQRSYIAPALRPDIRTVE